MSLSDDKQELENKKKIVQDCAAANLDNAIRFHSCRRFLYYSTLNDDDKAVLNTLQKPTIEFNFLEAFVNRLMGEFCSQIPGVIVSNSELIDGQVSADVINALQGYLQYIIRIANTKDGFAYSIMEDCYSGGYSVARISHDYTSENSFLVSPIVQRVFDPTLTGFDILAKKPDKSDGRFCFELYPKSKKEFMEEFPNVSISTLGFSGSTPGTSGFYWSYREANEEIVVLCDFYEKVRKKIKIIQLANGEIIEKNEYQKYLQNWRQEHPFEQEPVIVNERTTFKTKIFRTVFIESQILFVEELKNYPGLPLIYIDGNSKMLREGYQSSAFWMTRPYIYNAIGIQKLKTFAGQTFANEIENMVQHKFMVAKEAIAPEYASAFKDIQRQQVVVWNAYVDQDSNKPVPKPEVIPRIGPPPEVLAAFQAANSEAQIILGSYDAALGINDNQLSGVAIRNGAMQSNAAALPYLNGFLTGLTSICQFLVEMFPYYLIGERSIPIINSAGLEDSVVINKNNLDNLSANKGVPIKFNYKPNSLKVKIQAGVNFKLQQSASLQQIDVYSKSFPMFSALMNDPRAINVLLDNMDFNGIDTLKQIAPEVIQKQMQAAQAQQMNNPMVQKNMLAAQKLQQEQQEMQLNAQLKQKDQEIAQQDILNDSLRILMEAKVAKNDQAVQLHKSQTEKEVHAMDYALRKHESLKDVSREKHDIAEKELEKIQPEIAENIIK